MLFYTLPLRARRLCLRRCYDDALLCVLFSIRAARAAANAKGVQS